MCPACVAACVHGCILEPRRAGVRVRVRLFAPLRTFVCVCVRTLGTRTELPGLCREACVAVLYAPRCTLCAGMTGATAARPAVLTCVRESRRTDEDEARGRFVRGVGHGWRRKGGFRSRRKCGRRHSRARCGTTRWQRAVGRHRRRCRRRCGRRMLRRIRLSRTASHAENAVPSCKATLAQRTPWGPIELAAGPLGRTCAAARCRWG
jgi:hypothetical protein